MKWRVSLMVMVVVLALESGGSLGASASLTAKTSPGEDPVVAQVGGEKIKQSEFAEYLDRLPAAARFEAGTAEGRLRLLQGYARQKSMVVLARRAGLERDPEYRRLLRPFEEAQLSKLYMDRLRGEITVSSASARAYYDAHPREFMEGEIHASHIVARTYDEAQKAQTLLKDGKSFAEVAKSVSIDRASAQKGGQMAPVRTGQVDPIFERTFQGLTPGQVSWIVNTAAGYELIRKDEEIKGQPKPLDKVAKDIETMLQSQQLYQRLSDAQARITIKIDEKALNSAQFPKPQ